MHLLCNLAVVAAIVSTTALSHGNVMAGSHNPLPLCYPGTESCTAWREFVAPILCQIADDTDPVRREKSSICAIQSLYRSRDGRGLTRVVKQASADNPPIPLVPTTHRSQRSTGMRRRSSSGISWVGNRRSSSSPRRDRRNHTNDLQALGRHV